MDIKGSIRHFHNHVKVQIRNPKGTLLNQKGESLAALSIILSLLVLLLISLVKIDRRISRFEYQKLKKFHKTWHQLEMKYGKN
ncbi:MAG: hypothetical protein ACJAS4_002916 [Bacteriovoracaceae bacterium]|jgi:hypothetical protein